MKKKLIITVVLAVLIAAGIYFLKRVSHIESEHRHGQALALAHDECSQHNASETKKERSRSSRDHNHEEEQAERQHADAVNRDGSEEARSFELSARREKLLGVKTVRARMLSLQNTLAMPGRFEWDQSAVRSYGVPASGFVNIKVKVPGRVKAGDTLFVVDSVELRRMVKDVELAAESMRFIESAIEALRQRVSAIKASGARDAELEMELALKKAELEQAVVQRDVLDFVLKEIIPEEAVMEDGKIVVKALRDGFVKKVGGVSGEWCQRGRELVRLVCSGALRFKAEALFSDSAGLSNGSFGEVMPTTALTSGRKLKGKVYLGFADAPDARVMPVFVDFEEVPEWVRPSMPGLLRVVTDESRDGGVVVPETCVVNSGIDQVLFVADQSRPGRYYVRKVAVGISDGDLIEIVSGLNQGERVVSAGVYQLRQEFASGESETKKVTGHFHADGEFHVDDTNN